MEYCSRFTLSSILDATDDVRSWQLSQLWLASNTTYYMVLCCMEKQTISFRADSKKVKALDRLARALDRDRTYLLNEAVEHYLSVQKYHVEEIEKGLEDVRAGKVLDYDEVKSGWMKRLRQ
jgi:predicted transcriptional regulator